MDLNFLRGPWHRHDEPASWLRSLNLQVYRRPHQRTITLRVDRQGRVRVGCSKTCPQAEIEKVLLAHREWIAECLKKASEHREQFPKKKFSEGEEFLFLGKRLKLHYQPTAKDKPKMALIGDRLVLFKPQAGQETDAHALLASAMLKFYKTSGVTLLQSLVETNAERMQLYPRRLSFRSQKSRWGSCSSAGNISLNWRLVCAPVRVANYVVVHELAHLKHHDHSANFWRLVESHCPEYKWSKNWLNQNQLEFDFLNL